jgi:histone family protein nucleoid-structuring protein H-NS
MTKSEEFNLVGKYLSNIVALRSFSKAKDLAFLEKACENLSTIIQEKKEMIELERMELEEREKNRQAILKELEERGWTIQDLLDSKGNKRKQAEYKYSYTDEQGNTKYWTGKGRTPVFLKAKLEAGESLEQYLIKPEI